MSESTFGDAYAGVYDLLYADKDYEAECDQLEALFRRYAGGQIRSILDLGCGTGGHAFPLARRGYRVTGVDVSAPMLALAQHKLEQQSDPPLPGRIDFVHGDVRSVELSQDYDAAIMMFAVLGYQTSERDVESALKTARRHMKRGGLFVFDVWYGPAVLSTGPTERTKVLKTPEGKLLRSATPSLDRDKHLCQVHYRLGRSSGEDPAGVAEELHTVRYFFPEELANIHSHASLELLHLSPIEDLGADPSESSWNVIGCARAV